MLSRRRSHVFSRKGSIDRSRESKFGYSGWPELLLLPPDFGFIALVISAREVGRAGGSDAGGVGSWWRKEVRRWELWIWSGSSRRMSW